MMGKKEVEGQGGEEKKKTKEEEGRKEGKKDVEAGRTLESSRNEVQPHEPYINQPRLYSLLSSPSGWSSLSSPSQPLFPPSRVFALPRYGYRKARY